MLLAGLVGLQCTAHRPPGATARHDCENACGEDPLCVSGRVTDEAGEPLADFTVGAFVSDEDEVSDIPFATTETDASGQYTFALSSALSTWRVSQPSAPGPFRILAIEYGYVIGESPHLTGLPACVDLVVEPVPAR